MAVFSAAVLRRVIEVLFRIDPRLWYGLDLRRRSVASWIPATLLLAAFVFGAVECLVAGNVAGGAVLSALAMMLLAVKMRAVAQTCA
jgi:hypothetical protein